MGTKSCWNNRSWTWCPDVCRPSRVEMKLGCFTLLWWNVFKVPVWAFRIGFERLIARQANHAEHCSLCFNTCSQHSQTLWGGFIFTRASWSRTSAASCPLKSCLRHRPHSLTPPPARSRPTRTLRCCDAACRLAETPRWNELIPGKICKNIRFVTCCGQIELVNFIL